MSAFLGPIHYWLFKKIQFQDDITNRILAVYEKQDRKLQLTQRLKEQYGELEQQPLENIIDGANIHGWLQERVAAVEYRLAYLVTEVSGNDPSQLSGIEQICFEAGRELGDTKITGVQELFQYFNDIFLDGMPCDHANEIITANDQEVVWKRNICVHRQYWEAVGGDTAHYYRLRKALIEGMLDDSEFMYEEQKDNQYSIKRRS